MFEVGWNILIELDYAWDHRIYWGKRIPLYTWRCHATFMCIYFHKNYKCFCLNINHNTLYNYTEVATEYIENKIKFSLSNNLFSLFRQRSIKKICWFSWFRCISVICVHWSLWLPVFAPSRSNLLSFTFVKLYSSNICLK